MYVFVMEQENTKITFHVVECSAGAGHGVNRPIGYLHESWNKIGTLNGVWVPSSTNKWGKLNMIWFPDREMPLIWACDKSVECMIHTKSQYDLNTRRFVLVFGTMHVVRTVSNITPHLLGVNHFSPFSFPSHCILESINWFPIQQ